MGMLLVIGAGISLKIAFRSVAYYFFLVAECLALMAFHFGCVGGS